MTTGASVAEAGPDRFARWAIALFFVAIFIPGSFQLGVRMTPYRLYLILMAIPLTLRFLRDPGLKVSAVDVLVLAAGLWQVAAILVNHRSEEIVFAGASFLEFFFGYMLGRVLIRNAADFRFLLKCFLVTLLCFLPFALVETAGFRRLLREVASVALVQPALDLSGQVRFGLMRAQLSFEHAILYGAFCSIGFANAWYAWKRLFPANLVLAGFTGFMTVLSISSAPMIGLALQAGLILYEAIFRGFRGKWILALVLAALFLVAFPLVAGQSFADFMLSNFVINQSGVDARIWQFEFGMREVFDNPFFGTALKGWAHPYWIGDVIDNFWLRTSVSYGAPTTLFLLGAILLQLARIARLPLSGDEADLRLGYVFAFLSLLFILSTVSLWAAIIVFKMVYLGAGAWFLNPEEPRAGPALRTRPPRAAPLPRSGAPRPARSLRS